VLNATSAGSALVVLRDVASDVARPSDSRLWPDGLATLQALTVNGVFENTSSWKERFIS
jgi:hypothetical protein